MEKIIADTKKWGIKVSGGVKVDLPLDPYGRIRVSRSFDLLPWNLYIGENYSWFNTAGFGSNTIFEFSRKLSENLLFHTNSQIIWKEVTDLIELNQTFSFYQTISDKHALAFDISIYAQDQFNINTNDYRVQTQFRQRIKGDWLFYQITPEALFQSDNNFNPNMLLTAGLEILFGGKHLHPPKDLQLEENQIKNGRY
ncbi:hypothetical protein [Kaarinaea lacus]